MIRRQITDATKAVQEHIAQYLRHLWRDERHGPRRIGMSTPEPSYFLPLKVVGIAISGGVDSMALATLCSNSRSGSIFTGFIVDHGMRSNSSEEAAKVANELSRIGIEPKILKLDWTAHGDPKELTNFEAIARRLRYQAIGKACHAASIRTLLLGHHADDQAETVLSRIVSGYLGAGLAGVRAEAAIPECAGIYGVDGSGWDNAHMQHETEKGNHDAGMLVESGGVNICRPLLPFIKNELIQVCRDKDVRWFEDPTNADQKLTVRNTIRHLHKRGVLPVALQRRRLIALACTIKSRSDAINAEVDRLFRLMSVELDLRLGRVRFTVDHDAMEQPGYYTPQSGADVHHIRSALLGRLMQLATNRSIILQDLERAVDIVFSKRPQDLAVQVGKINIQPVLHSSSDRDDRHEFVMFRQKPSNSDVLSRLQLAMQAHGKDQTTGWVLWDDRYWLRPLYYPSEAPPQHSPSMLVCFLTPSTLGNLRKTLNSRQQLLLEQRLQAAKAYGVVWTLPVLVAREGSKEHVVSIPSLRWNSPEYRRQSSDNAESHMKLEIRYKSVDFESSGQHRLIP